MFHNHDIGLLGAIIQVENLPDLQVPSSAVTTIRNCTNIKNHRARSRTCM